jgi:hypothetical protein
MNRQLKYLILTSFAILSVTLGSIAQQKPGRWFDGFALDAAQGYTILHEPERMAPLAGWPYVIQAEIIKHQNGYRHWHKYYNNPSTGISIQYMNFDNPFMGHAIALGTFLEPQLFHNSRYGFSFRLGTGIVYNSNPYHQTHNPDQIALGSSVNAVMQTRLKFNYQLERNMKAYAFGDFTHFSNGSMKMPNAGINVPSLGVGFTYMPPSTQNFFIDEEEVEYQKWRLNLRFIVSGKESSDNPGVRRGVYGLSAYVGRRISPVSAITIGADYDYNLALRERLRKHQSEGRFLDINDISRVGVHIGHELFFGNVSLLTQFATYVHKPYQTYKNVYQRYGLRWYMTENIVFGYALRTHLSKADYLEFSMGYSF